MERKYEFYLDKVEEDMANEWMKKEKEALVKSQQQDEELVKRHPEIAQGCPYVGAIGGLFKFTFVRTSLGDIVSICNTLNGNCVDITNYDSW